MKRIGIWGWWQGNNLGDNWIKNTLKKIFPYAVFIDTTVLDFKDFDFIICGGGGLFIYDVISPWNTYIGEVPYGMLGLGAEFPHKSNISLELAGKAEFFLARDQYSLDCMHISNLERSYDITFASPLLWRNENEIDLSKLYFIWRDGKELTNNKQFKEYICYKNVKDDWECLLRNNFSEIIQDDFQTSEANIQERISQSGFIISGRYHGIIAAIQSGLPFIAIDICPKIRALTKECGLDEYCIKISDIESISDLIQSAKLNIQEIRKREKLFCTQAVLTLQNQINIAKKKIFKRIKPFRIIHYGSYWMGNNDVVNVMSDDLINYSDVNKINLNIYEKADDRVKAKISTPNGCICILDTTQIANDIEQFHPDCLILNSGGLILEDDAFHFAKKSGVIVIGISLSDPDVYPYNGQLYAHKFDLFYTNSKYAYENLYNKRLVNIKLMPFAASLRHHYYMPHVEKIYDIVIVGHARKNRLEIVKKLSKYFKVGTFGNGWEESLGEVHGIEHVKAINSGIIYLSFAGTVAGYYNVKVGLFEAMACNQVVVTEYMEELKDYFKIGEEILCYHNEKELLEIMHFYLSHIEERERIRKNAYTRFLKDHTYERRWEQVIEDIFKLKEMIEG